MCVCGGLLWYVWVWCVYAPEKSVRVIACVFSSTSKCSSIPTSLHVCGVRS